MSPFTRKDPAYGNSLHCFQLLFYLQEWEGLNLKLDLNTYQPAQAMEPMIFYTHFQGIQNNKGYGSPCCVIKFPVLFPADPPQADPTPTPKGSFWLLNSDRLSPPICDLGLAVP